MLFVKSLSRDVEFDIFRVTPCIIGLTEHGDVIILVGGCTDSSSHLLYVRDD